MKAALLWLMGYDRTGGTDFGTFDETSWSVMPRLLRWDIRSGNIWRHWRWRLRARSD